MARSFVPVADKVEPFQKGRPASSPEAEFFWKISRQRKDSGDPPGQGVYAATPSGKLLAFRQTDHDPVRILEMLKGALDQWNRMDPRERQGSEAPAAAGGGDWRGESRLPEGGLVLQLFVRDLPRTGGGPAPKFAAMWNQDYVWFTREEVRSMIPSSRKPGDRQPVPERLVRRLARVHFLDIVRGVVSPFEERHVEKAEMDLTVEKAEGDVLHLRIQGATRAERPAAKGKPRVDTDYALGYEGRILGRARVDVSREEFLSVDLLSLGTRWGGTLHNTRLEDNDVAPNPIGYALRLLPVAERTDFRAPLHAVDYFKR